MRRLVNAVAASAVLAVGCARGEPERLAEGTEGSAALAEGLVHSLNVQVEGDTVRFTLHVTNAGLTELVLEYSTAQRYDFVVETPDGSVVWRWAEDQGFAQMLSADTVRSGETLEYEARWPSAGRTGRYSAVGRVTSTNSPVELRTEFEIPES